MKERQWLKLWEYKLFLEVIWSCFYDLAGCQLLSSKPWNLSVRWKRQKEAHKQCCQMQGCTLETMTTPSKGWTHVPSVFPYSTPPCYKSNAICSIATNWKRSITLLWWTFLMTDTDGIAQTKRLLVRIPHQWPNTDKASAPFSKSTQSLPISEPTETTKCTLGYCATFTETSLLRQQSFTVWRLYREGFLLLVNATSPSSWDGDGAKQLAS